ncbi:MAG TPA: prephenate dehydrogenase [Candidatus Nanopelagicaceae bacterium]
MKGVRVVGSGLIGTSIALALSAKGIAVQMADSDDGRAALAQDLVGSADLSEVDLVVLALPSSHLSQVITHQFSLHPKAAFIDVGSVKTKPLDEVERISGLASRFCGTHPMAGREIGGPEAARSDLFQGRPWIYTPTPGCDTDVVSLVIELIHLLGAIPIKMTAEEHDSAVALISHLPQIGASLIAKQLLLGPGDWLALAGQGVKDTTRIAASDPVLWREIISMNRDHIRPLLKDMSRDLAGLIADFDNDDAVELFIEEGREGRGRIPGKHGGRARDYTFVPIVIEDKPGQLAALFQECADIRVNIEDLSIEHSPGQFTGLVTLALSKDDATRLAEHLATKGWNVHPPR